MNQNTLENLLTNLPLGGIRYFDSLGSTNDEAARWAAEGAADLSLVVADEQTAGRGRGERHWFTPPGSALAFSLILRPSILEDEAYITPITGLGALAVCRVLQQHYQLPAEIKWPNDVLLTGRKTCGVLAEASWIGDTLQAVILGIGINVAPSSVPPENWPGHHQHPFAATSVEHVLGKPVERTALLRAVLHELTLWYPRLAEPEFVREWDANLALRGEWALVFPSEAEALEARIINLNIDGSLNIRLRTGEQRALQVGEIHLRPVDSSPK